MTSVGLYGGVAKVISNYNIICDPYYAILGKDDKGNLIGGGGGGAGSLSNDGGYWLDLFLDLFLDLILNIFQFVLIQGMFFHF